MFTGEPVGIGAAFVAGLLTFFSPCVLPLIPAWLTLISGLGYQELVDEAQKKRRTFFSVRLFIPTFCFVFGFGLVFILMGAAAGAVGDFLIDYDWLFRYLGGAVLLVLALYLLEVISPAFLMRERRAEFKKRPFGLLGSFLVGLAFGAGWTPCVGPVLAAILSMAAMRQNYLAGAFMLSIFSLGLALPFLILSLLWGEALSFLAKARPITRWVNRILGVLVLVLAVLLVVGYF